MHWWERNGPGNQGCGGCDPNYCSQKHKYNWSIYKSSHENNTVQEKKSQKASTYVVNKQADVLWWKKKHPK